jgi:hypothetical protein
MRSNRNRLTTMTLTLMALALSGLAPGAASAGSLLSGYGGPGEGNQAILGSALLNGPSGTGGSGGGSPRGSVSTDRSTGYGSLIANGKEAATPGRASAAPAGSSGGRSSKSAGREKHAKEGVRKASGSVSQTYPHISGPSALAVRGGGSQALGLSGADLLYILLALGVLVLTGVLTSRLVRANLHRDGVPAQAMRRRTRLTN